MKRSRRNHRASGVGKREGPRARHPHRRARIGRTARIGSVADDKFNGALINAMARTGWVPPGQTDEAYNQQMFAGSRPCGRSSRPTKSKAPHLRCCRLEIANNCLTTLMDEHALDPDDLRASSLPIQRVEHVGHAPGEVRAILPQLQRHFGLLIVHHSPGKG